MIGTGDERESRNFVVSKGLDDDDDNDLGMSEGFYLKFVETL